MSMYLKSLGSHKTGPIDDRLLKNKQKKTICRCHYYQYITLREDTKFKDSKREISDCNLFKFHGQENGATEHSQSQPVLSLPGPHGLSLSMVCRHLNKGAESLHEPSAHPLHPLCTAGLRRGLRAWRHLASLRRSDLAL